MTVSINPAPTLKATVSNEPTAPAKDGKDGAKAFGKLIDSADTGNGLADAPVEGQQAPAQAPADQSLEAILSALKLTLAPGAGLLKPAARKAGEGDKDTATNEKPAREGEEGDPAAALLAALIAPSLPAPIAAKDLAGQARQAIDDVLVKPAAASSLTSLGDASPVLAALPPTIDLKALVDTPAIKPPEAAAPAAVQLERLLDTARDAAWLDRLSQDIAASAGAGDKMRFRMMPPNLGALDVSVERQAAGMSVSMTTHTNDARNLIADSRQQMVDSLKAQGVPLVQLSLSTAGEDLERHRPPNFFNHLIEAVPQSGTDLAAQPVESTTVERVGRFA